MSTELIPKLEFDSPLETALAANDSFAARVEPLYEKAKTTEIVDAATYGEVGAVLTQVRSIRKNELGALWAPFFGVIERARDFVRSKRQAVENRCEEIDALCTRKMKEWEQREKKASAAEAAKMTRKAGQTVEVKPNIPPVQGYRQSTTYPVTVQDENELIRALLRAYKATNTKRVQFLRQFVCVDVKALERYARELKNPEQFNKEIPGVTCRQE